MERYEQENAAAARAGQAVQSGLNDLAQKGDGKPLRHESTLKSLVWHTHEAA